MPSNSASAAASSRMARCSFCCLKPAAFRVKHPETTRHWRCLGCFRDLARDAAVIVDGVAVHGRVVEHNAEEGAGPQLAIGKPI